MNILEEAAVFKSEKLLFTQGNLAFSLEERSKLIDQHTKELLYICRQLKSFKNDVEHIMKGRMPKSMISNITFNLVHNLVSCYLGLTVYEYLTTAYLLSDNYNDNYRLWKIYTRYSKEVEDLITNLEKENVFNLDEYAYIENLIPLSNTQKNPIRSLLNLEHLLSMINGEGLFHALIYYIRSIGNRLERLKIGLNDLTDDDFKTIYIANYNYYKEKYWPSEVTKFRQHIEENYFRRNHDKIEVLEKLLWDDKLQFRQDGTGRLWRDYFMDKKQLYFEMRRASLDNEQWKYFFYNLCRFEEYEKWIEEIQNNPILTLGSNNNKNEDTGSEININERIVSFFTNGILSVEKPSLLYFLLLAMWARRLLDNKEIPSFVRMVGEAYPALFNKERTEDRVIMSLQNMNGKADQFYDVYVKDQATMIEYIDLMYPLTKSGKRIKKCVFAVDLANKLFLGLK